MQNLSTSSDLASLGHLPLKGKAFSGRRGRRPLQRHNHVFPCGRRGRGKPRPCVEGGNDYASPSLPLMIGEGGRAERGRMRWRRYCERVYTTSSVSFADRLPPCRICRLRAGMKTCPQSGAAAEIPPRLFPPPAAAGRNSPTSRLPRRGGRLFDRARP